MIRKAIKILVLSIVSQAAMSYAQTPGDITQELATATPEYINTTYEKALLEFESQNYDQSLQYIRHVIKSDMTNYKLRYLAAHNHWKKGSFESATVHFQTAISVQPDLPNAYMDLALLKIHERNYYLAERTLQSAIYRLGQKNIPVPAKLYNIYTRLELLKGFPDKALRYAELSKSAFSQTGTGIKDKLEAVTLEARSQLLLGNYEKAELSAQWALTLKPNNVYGYNLLGYIYSEWSKSIAPANPQKSAELKKSAAENFEKALENKGIVDEVKTIVEANLLNSK